MFRANKYGLNPQICMLLGYFYHLNVIYCHWPVRPVGSWTVLARLLTYRAVLGPCLGPVGQYGLLANSGRAGTAPTHLDIYKQGARAILLLC